MVDRFGADAARCTCVRGAPGSDIVWSDAGVEGAQRSRGWTFAETPPTPSAPRRPGRISPGQRRPQRLGAISTRAQAGHYDYERIQYNTVVSAGMKMLNALEAVPAEAAGRAALLREGLSILVRTLYPVVPHNGCALWDELGFAGEFGPLLDAPWPQADPAAIAQDEIELVLQVNEARGKLTVAADADGKSIEAAARAGIVTKHAAGAPVKVIVVPGRLVNVVV
jgi:leucyl-tRNA synthetase